MVREGVKLGVGGRGKSRESRYCVRCLFMCVYVYALICLCFDIHLYPFFVFLFARLIFCVFVLECVHVCFFFVYIQAFYIYQFVYVEAEQGEGRTASDVILELVINLFSYPRFFLSFHETESTLII